MRVALVFSAVATRHCRVFAEKVVAESRLPFGENLLKQMMFHRISHGICLGLTHGISQRLGRFVTWMQSSKEKIHPYDAFCLHFRQVALHDACPVDVHA
jgi:hypothetical protein